MIDVKLGVEAKVQLSKDKLKGFLTLIRVTNEEKVSPEFIYGLLKENGIVYGINDERIKAICNSSEDILRVVIAEGFPRKDGEDAKIHYHFNKVQTPKPCILENGQVDFKNLGYVETVTKGTVLASKKPAIEARKGKTVTGDILCGKDGKDINFIAGANCILSEDKLSIIAETDGIVKIENRKVVISKLLEVKGDVGVETGNISFCGQIIVYGNVTKGYKVECDDDLIVHGLVEGANLNAGGDIVIAKGIQGDRVAKINCGGNLAASYINCAIIYVKGNVEVGEVINSTLLSGGKIKVMGQKGQIIGGEIVSHDLEANTIGSELGVYTSIKLGNKCEIIKELNGLLLEVEEKSETVKDLQRCLALIKAKITWAEKDLESYELYQQYYKRLLALDRDLYDTKERIVELKEMLMTQKGFLEAKKIYSDTYIKMGNAHLTIKEKLTHIHVTEKSGKIIVETHNRSYIE